MITASRLQAGILLARTFKSAGGTMLSRDDVKRAAKVQKSLDGDKSRLDFDGAIEMGAEFGWGVFSTDEDIRVALSESLLNLATHPQFDDKRWVEDSSRGRLFALARLDASPQKLYLLEILSMAKLLTETDRYAQAWWARLQNFGRLMQQSKTNSDYWMICERASFDREKSFLSKHQCTQAPEFKSIEDSTEGYDLGSFRQTDDGSWVPYYIEVKSTVVEFPRRFHISVNEWRFAERNRNSWQLDFYGPNLADLQILKFEQVAELIPKNTEFGIWNECTVTIE